MRVEGISPRTWLLGTVAGWALVLWVLALAGMGSRVAHLPDDPSLVSRLPQLAPAPAERLGPLAQYANITAHPLFSTDRQPQPFYLTKEGDEDAQPAFDYVLTSVLITPVLSMAIVQPSEGGDSVRIKLGESADAQPAYRLTTINPRSAVFEGPDGPHTLELRVFDGTGGESTLVDGFKVAEVLRTTEPELFDALSTIAIPGQYIGDGSHLMAARPVFRHDHNGALVQVSYNNSDRAPFLLPPEEMTRLYSALRAFDQLANSESMQWKQVLRPGDALLFDNWRTLHGRHAYSGRRTMCGAYLNHEDFESRLRTAG